jgi:pimeloyl-ACP methyl ester carboxylesterase
MKKIFNTIYSGRTRFAQNIVAEFWIPKKPSHKAIILCDGCPTVPSKRKVGEFFARKGYWVFHLRYRGSWESGGKFLEESPDEDVLSVAEGLNAGFRNIYDDVEYLLDVTEIVVVGASFGGAAAILSLKYPLITKAIALSPVIDWRVKSKGEPFPYFVHTVEEGFGEGYRVHKDAWKRLESGKFFNPIAEAKLIDPKRLFIAHATDDNVVPVAPLRAFAKLTKVRPLYLKTGGHFSASTVMSKDIWDKVKVFLKS